MLLTGARILTMDGRDIACGYVQVQGSRIMAVGEWTGAQKLSESEQIIDLEGKLLLPGFIDAHSHMGLVENGLGFEGDDLNEDTDPCTPQLRALDGINPFDACFAEARSCGVTCAVISPGSTNPIAGQICALKTVGRWVDEMAVKQPLAIKFALGENPKMVYSAKAEAPVTRMAAVAIIREQLHKAYRYLKDVNSAEQDVDLELPDYDAKCEALIPLLKGEVRAHFHAHKAYDILSAVRIAQEFSLNYTIVHCTEGYLIADILAAQKASAICGPLICARTKPELVNHSVQNCAKLLDAGVTVAISTDHPELPVDFLATSAAFAVANGLDSHRALEAMTIAAAKAVGLQDTLGSITPGKDADLLVFSADPLSLYAKPERVFINGVEIDVNI